MAHDDFHSDSGRQLYQLLPAIYRVRDGSEAGDGHDLARYLDSFGEILDGLRALLDQQLADAFPDDQPSPRDDAEPRLAQDWVLPYLGALVDARPISVDPRSQRSEIASAVRWRQRKGTVAASEELTEAVGRVSAVLHEGWQRVAVTARVGARNNPLVTVDTRLCARAVVIDRAQLGAEPGTDFTRFEGVELPWRVVDRQGVPRARNGYQDLSLRTVDVREPSSDRTRGLYHPRRLLAWIAPEDTLFPLPPRRISWAEFVDDKGGLRLDTGDEQEFVCGYRGDVEIVIPAGETLELGAAEPYRIEGLRFAGPVRVPRATLAVRQCHFRALELRAASLTELILDAQDSFFGQVVASQAKLGLDACTVRGPLICLVVDAKACIFTDIVGERSDGSRPIEVAEGSTVSSEVQFLVDDLDDPAAAVLDPNNDPQLVSSEGRELGRYRRGRPHPVVIAGDLELAVPESTPGELTDLVVDGTLRAIEGELALRRVAARRVEIVAPARVVARSCLFDDLHALATPTVDLEYCTVMHLHGQLVLRASDCVLVDGDAPPSSEPWCLRWSSLPASWPLEPYERCVHGLPWFLSERFGDRLYGLLSPTSSASVRSGAEDGGELGGYHDSYWLHRLAGVEDKLRDHIPIGITPVLIPDPSLIDAPPQPEPAPSGEHQ